MNFNIILTVDSDCLKYLETKLVGKDIPQESSLATTSLHTAASLNMSQAHKVNVSQVVDHLKQLKMVRNTTDTINLVERLQLLDRTPKFVENLQPFYLLGKGGYVFGSVG